MQLGTDLSTSQVEYNFIGTGFVLVAQKVPPPSADMFVIKTDVFFVSFIYFQKAESLLQYPGVRCAFLCMCSLIFIQACKASAITRYANLTGKRAQADTLRAYMNINEHVYRNVHCGPPFPGHCNNDPAESTKDYKYLT